MKKNIFEEYGISKSNSLNNLQILAAKMSQKKNKTDLKYPDLPLLMWYSSGFISAFINHLTEYSHPLIPYNIPYNIYKSDDSIRVKLIIEIMLLINHERNGHMIINTNILLFFYPIIVLLNRKTALKEVLDLE